MLRFIVPLVFCQTALSLGAAPIEFRSGTNQTALVELYTSEGCSSCPPAETWFSRLQAEPQLWREWVPVAFHVDYWDHLGWKDAFARKSYSDRQQALARAGAVSAVYTPGFVVAGREWRGWFRDPKLPLAATRPAGVLTARSEDGKKWRLRFQPANPLNRAQFNIAVLGFGLDSDIKAGENRGRKLTHDFVVLNFATVSAGQIAGTWETSVTPDLTSKFTAKRLALGAWVTAENSLQPLQATGGWLPDKQP